MTTVVILMMGFGVILIISAIETDPATGNGMSVLQTFSDVWNNRVSFSQPGGATGGATNAPSTQPAAAGTSVRQTYAVQHYIRSRYR